MRLKDRVAIVTGAARGIGRGIALALAREGARVAACDLDLSMLDDLVGQVRAGGGEVLALAVDVTRKDQILGAVDQVLARWGRLDVLVNNAGIYEVLPVEAISEAQWDRVLAVNLKGTFLCCQAVIPAMKRQGSGCIVSIASSAGKSGGTLAGAHYSASKAGVICLTKQLARELGPHGITANAVAPGRIDTPMIHLASDEENEGFRLRTPLGRLGTPEDVAGAVVFLASDEASFITGEIVDVNGGLLID
ncbi:MAG TPA: SDR family NAD(P)-dependent oxidoreductase [Anaerolineae bacterium]|nr:SDR family NAD(P)-dependent oxidoreductase [Anaerolineae bacterium]